MTPGGQPHSGDFEPAAETQPASVFDNPFKLSFAFLGGLMLMAMMALTVCDVIGRYVFNAPVVGATELTGVLLAAIIFLGVPAVSLDTEHVTVDLVSDRVPRWIVPFRRLATGLISSGILMVVAWRIWVYAGQIGGYGGTTTTLELPVAPLGCFCALCCLFGSLLTLYVTLTTLSSRTG
ncbi:MAG: TRAP transporter small permease [Rhodobacteraceae bacterium]|nr:TRAP transporter small permease [Paracoccaceae bacterium]